MSTQTQRRRPPNAAPVGRGGAGTTRRPATMRRPLARQVPQALRAMRPRQWVKNGLVLLALVFARKLTDLGSVERDLLTFAAFSLAASSIYLVNDLADRERDHWHPTKRRRPVASGALGIPLAITTACLCALGALLLTIAIAARPWPGMRDPFAAWGGSPLLLVGTVVSYLALNVAYSFWLKHLVLWDVFSIAAGFVLRAMAGAFAIWVPISPWFYVCTTFLALLLALGKRRAELVQLRGQAELHRENLNRYTLQLIDQLIAILVTSTLISYSLYTFQGEAASHALMLTIPFVLFGMARYLYLLYVRGEGERPDELLYKDRQILGAVVLCVVVILAMLYGLPLLHR